MMFETKDNSPHSAHDPQPRHFWRGIFARVRNNFITGLVVLVPIGVTIWLVWTVTGWIDGVVLPLVPSKFNPEVLFGIDIRGLGVVFFLLFTLLIGWMAKGMIGRSFIHWGERVVARMPVVRSVYNGIKQIAETVFAQSEQSFDRVVLIEYPRKGLWGLGFVSTSAKGEVNRRIPVDEQVLSVFLPTTPNPTSGFLLFVPRSEAIELDMSVEEAAKLIISAGLVAPEEKVVAAPEALQEFARRQKIGA